MPAPLFTRRTFVSLAALSAAAIATGCTGEGETGESAAPTTGGDSSPTTANNTPITLLSSGDADVTTGQGKALTDILTTFSDDTGTPSTLERVPFDQYLASATTKARADKLSDVVELLPGANFAALFPALVDLTKEDIPDADALSGWEATVKDPANPEVFAGAPIGAQGVVWYYNKALFEEAGLDPEQPPKTWDELKTAGQALQSAGIEPIGMSGADSFILWWAWSSLSPQFFSAEDVNAVRTGDVELTDERFSKSLEPLKELYDDGLIAADYEGKKFTDVEADFAAGKVGIVPGIISNAINWQVWDDKMGTDAYGVMTAPTISGATLQGQFFNPVLMFGVNAKSENPVAAMNLVAAMVSQEGQTTLLKEASQFPNRTDVDVVGITGSSGAGAILDIVKEVGGMDVAQNQFNGAAQQASWTHLTQTMQSGDITGFLDDLEKQQRS